MENIKGCAHAEELVTVLFGEATELEKHRFEQHLQACEQCSSEFASFSGIQESIHAWRRQTVGLLPGRLSVPVRETRPRSAMAALRELLDLSPLWMKAAVAAASVLLCLLAGLAIVRLREVPRQPIVSQTGYSEEQLRTLAEKLAQEKVAKLRLNEEQASPVAGNIRKVETNQREPRHARLNTASQLASTRNKLRPLTKPLTKAEREQLAADLRLTETSEAELDLLGDRLSRPDK